MSHELTKMTTSMLLLKVTVHVVLKMKVKLPMCE